MENREKKSREKKKDATCDVSLKPILTESEACIFLGMSRSTLHDLRMEGKIGFYREKKTSDKKILSIRYRREQLLNYIETNYDEVKPLKLKYQ